LHYEIIGNKINPIRIDKKNTMRNKNYTASLLGLMLIMLISFNVSAQESGNERVTGKVFPAGLQTAMADVEVRVQDSDFITVTNAQGMFSVYVTTFPVTLIFAKKSYETQTVKVKRPSDISVLLMVAKKSK
jgi:hypothetical protein